MVFTCSKVASVIVQSDHWEKAMKWPPITTEQNKNSVNNDGCNHTTGKNSPMNLLIRRMPGTNAHHNF